MGKENRVKTGARPQGIEPKPKRPVNRKRAMQVVDALVADALYGNSHPHMWKHRKDLRCASLNPTT